MTILIFGLALFFANHAIPMFPRFRAALIELLGTTTYQVLFSLEALAATGLIVWGYSTADTTYWYAPVEGGRHLTMVLVLLAFMFLAAFALKGHIRKKFRHPMSIGVALWAVGHLVANGDSVSVVLFGGLLVYSLLDILISSGTKPRPDFTPQISHDIIAVLAGTVIYAILLYLHPTLFGVVVVSL